jgi:hypothetical protein
MEIDWHYLRAQEDRESVMKRHISVVTAAIAALSMGLHPVSASLLGMPLNLKVAIELRDVDALAPACPFYTDDAFAGPVLIKNC